MATPPLRAGSGILPAAEKLKTSQAPPRISGDQNPGRGLAGMLPFFGLLMVSGIVSQGRPALGAVARGATATRAAVAADVVPYARCVLWRIGGRRWCDNGRLLEFGILRPTQRRLRRGGLLAGLVVVCIVVLVFRTAHRAGAGAVAPAARTIVRADVVHYRRYSRRRSGLGGG